MGLPTIPMRGPCCLAVQQFCHTAHVTMTKSSKKGVGRSPRAIDPTNRRRQNGERNSVTLFERQAPAVRPGAARAAAECTRKQCNSAHRGTAVSRCSRVVQGASKNGISPSGLANVRHLFCLSRLEYKTRVRTLFREQ